MTKSSQLFSQTAILIAMVIIVVSSAFFVKALNEQPQQDSEPVAVAPTTPAEQPTSIPTSQPTVTASTLPGDYEDWETFTNEEFGFSIKYPANSGWTVYKGDHDAPYDIVIFSIDPPNSTKSLEDYGGNIIVVKGKSERDRTLYNFSSREVISKNFDIPIDRIVLENVMFSDIPATKYVVKFSRSEDSIARSNLEEYSILDGKYPLLFRIFDRNITNKEGKDAYLVMEKIAQSLTLTK